MLFFINVVAVFVVVMVGVVVVIVHVIILTHFLAVAFIVDISMLRQLLQLLVSTRIFGMFLLVFLLSIAVVVCSSAHLWVNSLCWCRGGCGWACLCVSGNTPASATAPKRARASSSADAASSSPPASRAMSSMLWACKPKNNRAAQALCPNCNPQSAPALPLPAAGSDAQCIENVTRSPHPSLELARHRARDINQILGDPYIYRT